MTDPGRGPQSPWPGYSPYGPHPAPLPPHRPRRPARPRPVDVRTSFELWCATAILGAVSVACAALLLLDRTEYYATRLVDEMHQRQPDVDFGHADGVLFVHLSVGLFAVIGVAAIAVLMIFAYYMWVGRSWARVLLGACAVMMTVFAVRIVFGGVEESGVAATAFQIAMILQAVLGVGAVALLYRSDSNDYFQPPAEGPR